MNRVYWDQVGYLIDRAEFESPGPDRACEGRQGLILLSVLFKDSWIQKCSSSAALAILEKSFEELVSDYRVITHDFSVLRFSYNLLREEGLSC